MTLVEMIRPKPPMDEPRVPRAEDVSPRVRELRNRIGELNGRRRELLAERDDALREHVDREGQKKRRVKSILSGEERKQFRHPAQVHDDIHDVQEAIEEAERQLIEAMLEASATIRQQIAPAYGKLVSHMADAMVELHSAWEKYKNFTDELNVNGIAWTALHPVHPHFLGEPTDAYGPVAGWFRDAAQRGLISDSMIPAGLRHA